MRALAVASGWVLLLAGVGAFFLALYLTGEGSEVRGFFRALVLGLAAGAVTATWGGVVVASRGFAERSWSLYALALVMHALWYVITMIIAESA